MKRPVFEDVPLVTPFTGRFTAHADSYARSRPSYPDAAIDALLSGLAAGRATVIADLGAGTGISSRLLARRGVTVYAIEPNAAMRTAAESEDGVVWLDATAEDTTLATSSVDAVVGFQAWHWFDLPAALGECARIVRPGGRIAVVYNERDEADPFTAAYGAIVRRYAIDETEQRRARARAGFESAWSALRHHDVPHAHSRDRDELHAYARSTSYLPPGGERADALHAELDTLHDTYARDGRTMMHLITHVAVADAGPQAVPPAR